MGLGVLEDTVLAHVPGTSDLLDTEHSNEQAIVESSLKYDRSGTLPILLVPQPSDDPNDPLNWPLWKRDITLLALSFVAVLCATTSSLMAANTVTIALRYRKSFTSVALLTGYHLCGVGVAGILIVPTARVWGGSANNYASLLWARIFQGVALAPFEALVNACVGDLYYVHERGKRMALSNVALFGAAFLTPVLAGKITHSLGWEWTFYLLAIFAAASLPLTFFLVPETAFRRPAYLNNDFGQSADQTNENRMHSQSQPNKFPESEAGRISGEKQSPSESQARQQERDTHLNTVVPAKVSYTQTLKPFNGRKTDEGFLKLLFRPFPLFFHPAILWACLIQGVVIGWTVFIGVVLAAIFLGPPLWFNEVQTGYLYTGAFIGSILGLILSGLLSDSMNKIMIKLNKGRYEPEFRILLVIFQLIFSGAGLYGFGIVAQDVGKYGWLVVDVFFTLVIIGMVMGAVASALYIVDAHLSNGVKPAFMAISSIQVGICALSIPMYILGKRNRSFFTRHDLLKILHLW
ncbi:hypothetical protein ETB97_003045 [Aspergillus alliaceus]|uniref:MFS transporter n=1 Tax=Petromyces alliaceus TaxID=209559 RepID=A0A8H6ABZ5_PETAA|nr:hypothetical protein ETB97_003045 [Aspergillus burnettii]